MPKVSCMGSTAESHIRNSIDMEDTLHPSEPRDAPAPSFPRKFVFIRDRTSLEFQSKRVPANSVEIAVLIKRTHRNNGPPQAREANGFDYKVDRDLRAFWKKQRYAFRPNTRA